MSQLMDIDRCQRLMEESSIDALLVTSPHNFGYVTGFFYGNVWSSPDANVLQYDHLPVVGEMDRSRNCGYAVVTRDASISPFAVVHIYTACTYNSWIKDIRIFGPKWWQQDNPADWDKVNAINMLCSGLREKGLHKALIGVEKSELSMSVFLVLKEKLPEATFVDAGNLLWKLREVKTAEEIRRITKAVDITVAGFNKALEAVREGMTEIEFANIIHRVCVEQGGDLPWIEMHFGANNKPNKAKFGLEINVHTPTDRTLVKGDFCLIDVGGVYEMYKADFCRIFWFGREPSKAEKNAYESILQAVDAAYEVIRPGTKCSEVFNVVEKILGPVGLTPSGAGHGVGLMIHEPPCFSNLCNETLQEGMVMALEICVGIPNDCANNANAYLKTQCLQCEEQILVTKDGVEQLSQIPRWIVK